MTTYDGIILGAGHNALILQAYAGLAGLSVLCIERRDIAGGGLSTEEDPHHPGFLHNTHAFFHRAITQMAWYRDLDLDCWPVVRKLGDVATDPALVVALSEAEGSVRHVCLHFHLPIF